MESAAVELTLIDPPGAKPVAEQTQSAQTPSPQSEPGNKKGKSPVVPWNPQDFYKDAAYFASEFGLPNEGDAPHKLADISDEDLTRVFGEGTRNGYKLSNVKGIPIDHILALSQIVDGYEKPVNGMLSHTFVKGVYADFKQNRKVNWAAYTATKLKGQVGQWVRDGKGCPDGPPCVRQPTRYVRPSSPLRKARKSAVAKCDPEDRPIFSKVKCEPKEEPSLVIKPEKVQGGVQGVSSAVLSDEEPPSPRAPEALAPIRISKRQYQPSGPNLLISLMESEICKMRSRRDEVKDKLAMVQRSVDKLKTVEDDHEANTKTLNFSIEVLRKDEENLLKMIEVEDGEVEELTTDIELECNKQCEDDAAVEDDNELLTFMKEKLNNHNATIKEIEGQLEQTREYIRDAVAALDNHVKKRADIPLLFSQWSKISGSLATDRCRIESKLKAQEEELKIVSSLFSPHCPVIRPSYTYTSTGTVNTKVNVSPCPICCNGFHCFNWIPASCGHTFHPACLFASIGGSEEAPQCFACGEAFSYDWLQTWGMKGTLQYEMSADGVPQGNQTMIAEMEELYGKNCEQLAKRRQWVKTRENMQEQVYLVDKAEQASTLMLSSTVPTCTKDTSVEDGASKPNLAVAKLEPEQRKRESSESLGEVGRKKPKRSLSRNTPYG